MLEPPPSAPPSKLLRFSCSIILVASAALSQWMMQLWHPFASIFESMVVDGVQGLPLVQRILLSHPGWWRAFVFGLAALSLLVIWRSPKENRVLLAGVLTTVFLFGTSIAIILLFNHTLSVVSDKFGP